MDFDSFAEFQAQGFSVVDGAAFDAARREAGKDLPPMGDTVFRTTPGQDTMAEQQMKDAKAAVTPIGPPPRAEAGGPPASAPRRG